MGSSEGFSSSVADRPSSSRATEVAATRLQVGLRRLSTARSTNAFAELSPEQPAKAGLGFFVAAASAARWGAWRGRGAGMNSRFWPCAVAPLNLCRQASSPRLLGHALPANVRPCIRSLTLSARCATCPARSYRNSGPGSWNSMRTPGIASSRKTWKLGGWTHSRMLRSPISALAVPVRAEASREHSVLAGVGGTLA
jgi:hypothetical protein